MSKRDELVWQARWGDTINHAAEVAVDLAKSAHKPVTLKFNEVCLTVTEKSKPDDVVRNYTEKSHKRAEDYLKTLDKSDPGAPRRGPKPSR